MIDHVDCGSLLCTFKSKARLLVVSQAVTGDGFLELDIIQMSSYKG